LKQLDFWSFVININNKKLLSGFLENLAIKDISWTISIIDKKDKVNREKLTSMFENNNLNKKQIDWVLELINLSENKTKTNLEIIKYFERFDNELLKEWLNDLKYVYNNLLSLWVENNFLKINPAISRGLNYYTGLVFETFIDWAENMWSISSGWRYDDLCSHFSKNNFPWVGWSIWLSRLLAVLDELKLLKYDKKTITDVLVLNIWEENFEQNLSLVKDLRDNWINTEMYLDGNTKFAKQIKYADNKKIKYVIIQWEDEIRKAIVQIKNLESWKQEEVKLNELNKYFK
jgi:histidyl-tRNA synthetase